jgi:hypothetical protein
MVLGFGDDAGDTSGQWSTFISAFNFGSFWLWSGRFGRGSCGFGFWVLFGLFFWLFLRGFFGNGFGLWFGLWFGGLLWFLFGLLWNFLGFFWLFFERRLFLRNFLF